MFLSRRTHSPTSFVGLVVALALTAAPLAAQQQAWLTQIGGSTGTEGRAVASDGAGGVVVVGSTSESLGGPNAGSGDVFLARHGAAGGQSWVRQFGTAQNDVPQGAAPDGQGGTFACGDTTGDLGGPHAGLADAWFGRFDASGNTLWLRQLGTGNIDDCNGVAADGQGGVFVAGDTLGALGGTTSGGKDVWLARYDGSGNQLWTRQFGGSEWDSLYDAAPDGAGGVLLCGGTEGLLVSGTGSTKDAWIARYDAAGSQLWVRQFGVPGTNDRDVAFGVAYDGEDGLYVAGTTEGDLAAPNAGYTDVWVARFDGAGNQLWIRQFGSVPNSSDFGAGSDLVSFCDTDGAGGVVLGGTVINGTFEGLSGTGYDPWISRYDGAGDRQWVQQFDLGALEGCADGTLASQSELYLTGYISDIPSFDGWVARFGTSCGLSVPYCSPSTTSVAGCEAVVLTDGSPSLSAPQNFTLSSGAVPGGNLGICFFGDNGSATIPFGSLGGLLCVAPPFYRTGAKPSGGTSGSCDGSYAFTLEELIAVSPIVVEGALIHAEIWARDPANADGYLLSSATRFQVCP